MTCVAGLIDNGKIYLGADSAGVDAWYNLNIRADSKVFINKDFAMGYTSSFRMGQLLRYKFNPPDMKESQDMFAYMVTDFIEEVRSCFKAGGYARIESNEDIGGVFLVGYKGRLFEISEDFQVVETLRPYNAIGCGGSYAMGSLFMTEGMGMDPMQRLRKALEAAQTFSAGVREPFNFI